MNSSNNGSFEDGFNGAVLIEQVTHNEIAPEEQTIVVSQDRPAQNWFKDTFKESSATYRNMFVASLFINILTVSLPFFAMYGLHNLSYGAGNLILPLGIGAGIASIYIAVLTLMRAHYLETARESADKNIADFFSHKNISSLFDLPFAFLPLVFICFLGGLLVLPTLVTFTLAIYSIFYLDDKKFAKYSNALLGLLFGLNIIIVVSYGLLMVRSNTMDVATLVAVVVLSVFVSMVPSKIYKLLNSYKNAKSSYDSYERVLRLSIPYDETLIKKEPSTQVVAWTIFSLLFVFIAWASLVQIDEKVSAKAFVVEENNTVKVQSVDGGIVEKVLVKVGDKVEANQTIVELNSATAQISAKDSKIKLLELTTKAMRLTAQYESKVFVPTDELIKGVPQTVKKEQLFYLKEIQLYLSSLERAKLALKLAGQNSAKAKEANAKIAQIRASFKENLEKELKSVNIEIDQLKNLKKLLDEKIASSTIKSPVAGVIKKVYIAGASSAIQPSVDMVEIEPSADHFFVNALIEEARIAFVRPGQESSIYTQKGPLVGKVVFVSPNIIKDSVGQKLYSVKIKVDKNKNDNNITGEVTASISTGWQSILSYVLKPIFKP